MVLFEHVADDYDAYRPSYPGELYDHFHALVDGLAGKRVADVGAGTGIASRQLLERGALVTAVEPGAEMLRRAVRRTPGLLAVNADGTAYPFGSESFDLICFGQSWHWVGQVKGAAEAVRVLRHGGYWAAWWNHPWA
jgi:SAM-dependent methyltransferase